MLENVCQGKHLDAGFRDASLAGARILDDDEGILAAPCQRLLFLLGSGLEPQLVQLNQSENRKSTYDSTSGVERSQVENMETV
jgi:hypothetical protein